MRTVKPLRPRDGVALLTFCVAFGIVPTVEATAGAPQVVAEVISTDPTALPRACEVPDWRPEYDAMRSAEIGSKVAVDDPAVSWLTNETARDNIEKVWQRLDEAGVTTVGGYVDLLNRKLVVVADPGYEAAAVGVVDSVRPSVAVEVHVGCARLAELEKVLADLKADAAGQRFIGEAFTSYIDARQGVVVVEAGPNSKLVADRLVTTYAGQPLILSEVEPPAPTVRCGDLPAHWGGALFKQGSSTNCSFPCTTGFKVQRTSDGKIGMSTAGHCRVLNGWSGNLYSKTSLVGQFYTWSYNATAFDDWGFVSDSSYANTIYTDPCCPSSRTVTGNSISTFVGDSLCLSGGVTTARCSMIVDVLTVQNCDASGNCANNTRATRSDGTVACQGGDSGAPWYKGGAGNTATIYGIQSFGTQSGGPTCFYNPVFRMMSDGFTVMTS